MKRDELFWEIVQTAPFVEADQMLRQRKYDALDRKMEATDAKEKVELSNLITRINDELHRLNRINRDYQMQVAIRSVFGEDAWELVKVWMAQNPSATYR